MTEPCGCNLWLQPASTVAKNWYSHDDAQLVLPACTAWCAPSGPLLMGFSTPAVCHTLRRNTTADDSYFRHDHLPQWMHVANYLPYYWSRRFRSLPLRQPIARHVTSTKLHIRHVHKQVLVTNRHVSVDVSASHAYPMPATGGSQRAYLLQLSKL